MDRKSIILLVICALLFFIGRPVIDHFFPAPPAPTNVVSQASNNLPETTNELAGATNLPAASAFAGSETSSAAFVVDSHVPEQTLVVTNNDARYIFTSRGGGIKEVELFRYPESISTLRRRRSETNEFATLNSSAVPPYLAILGTRSDTLQGDGSFTLTQTNGVVRAEKSLTNGITLVKEFQLGTNYLVTASVRLENRTGRPINLPAQHWLVGAATPMSPQDNGLAMGVMWTSGDKPESIPLSYFNTNTTAWLFFPHTPVTEFNAPTNKVQWLALQNQFFTLATVLTNPAPGFHLQMVNLPPPTQEELEASPRTVRMPQAIVSSLDYPAETLPPGYALARTLFLYAGPKQYRTLAAIGDRFENNLEWVMGFSGTSFFGRLIGAIAKMLLGAVTLLHNALRLPYGWAIVVLTALIKLIFWPITQYSTRSMKRMQALGPQMKALQDKYKDDPTKQQEKLWEFYRKNKINPLSSCLPMLLQLPLLYGFYRMLQSAIELRGAPFLWIGDLSKPDTLFIIPGLNWPLNPMPLIMGGTMLWQSHLTPPSPGMDPAQQRMMRFTPLIFLIFMYNVSSGLALYWTVQNLLSILQTKLIQRDTAGDAPAVAAKAAASAAPQKKKK